MIDTNKGIGKFIMCIWRITYLPEPIFGLTGQQFSKNGSTKKLKFVSNKPKIFTSYVLQFLG